MKFRTLLLTLALTVPGFSQVMQIKEIELNDGKKYTNCSVVEETDQYWILMVPVEGSGVRDEMKFMKSNVKKVVVPTQEEIDIVKLRRVFPQGDPAPETLGDYTIMMEKFMKKYPESQFKAEIDAVNAKIKEYQDHLDAGDIKVGGKWVTKSEQEKNGYSIASKRLLAMVKAKASARDYRGSLNAYEKLKKEFPSSEACAEALKIAIKVAPVYIADLKAKRDAAFNEDKAIQDQINQMPTAEAREARKKRVEQLALERQEARNQGDDERRNGAMWETINEKDHMVIDGVLIKLNTYRKTLDADVAKEGEAAPVYADAVLTQLWDAIEKKNLQDAQKLLSDTSRLRVQEEYRAPLKEKVDALKAEKEAERKAAADALAAARQKEYEEKRAKEKKRQEELAKRREALQAAAKKRNEEVEKKRKAKSGKSSTTTDKAKDPNGDSKDGAKEAEPKKPSIEDEFN